MRYKLNTDVIDSKETHFKFTREVVYSLEELGILIPVEKKECCDECYNHNWREKISQGAVVSMCIKNDCTCHKDNPATTVAKFVDFLDKETLNPYDVRVEPTTDKEEWGEADFQALFAGYYSSQNKIREFIHRAEKEAVQKSRKDWLREEINRLKFMERPANVATAMYYVEIGYNEALSDIQDHYQKELDKGDTNN